MAKPDFFLVGAPKSGTTSLYEYLRQHPDVFLPAVKTPAFFSTDIPRRDAIRNEAEYLTLYSTVSTERRIGDASDDYLFSKVAPRAIKRFCPTADIMVILRNPVDNMYARHAQLLYAGVENIVDFERAIAAEPDRRAGRKVPRRAFPEQLLYTEWASYSYQIERYLREFGRDRICITLFDDLQSNPAAVYSRLLEFLGIDSGFRPEFEVYNPSKRIRSRLLQQLLRSPPEPLRRLVATVLPTGGREVTKRALRAANSVVASRVPLDPEFRKHLLERLAPEIERLEGLIGVDLHRWHESPDAT